LSAPVGDFVHLGLRAVYDGVDVTFCGIAKLHDPRASRHQAAQDGPLADDLGVVTRVCRGRHAGHQRVQVGRSADSTQVTGAGQFCRHSDRVGRLAAPVQVEYCGEDRLMRRGVEVVIADHLDHIRDGILAQQHPAEHALLRGEILWRGAVEVDALERQFRDAQLRSLADEVLPGSR
jgi:hypothetical protein